MGFITWQITKTLDTLGGVKVTDTLTQDDRFGPPFQVGEKVNGFGGAYTITGIHAKSGNVSMTLTSAGVVHLTRDPSILLPMQSYGVITLESGGSRFRAIPRHGSSKALSSFAAAVDHINGTEWPYAYDECTS